MGGGAGLGFRVGNVCFWTGGGLGSKLGLESSEEGWESKKVSGKSALWLQGLGEKRPPHKILGSPCIQRVSSRRIIQERRWESHHKSSGVSRRAKRRKERIPSGIL